MAAVIASLPTAPSIYETITVGVSGIRMFFDVEYCICTNGTRGSSGIDARIVPEIASQVDRWLATFSQVTVTVKHATSIALGGSDATKFSLHVIFHFTDGYLLPGMAAAKHCAQYVSQHGNQDVLSVIGKGGCTTCVIDSKVYNNNQQYRCMGWSKDGKRKLMPLQGSPTFAETLVVPACGVASILTLSIPSSSGQALHTVASVLPVHVQQGVAAEDELCCSSLSHYIQSCLATGTVYKVASFHNSYGATSPSLYLYTSCKQCARKTHSSNTIKVEVCFRSKAWRTLCRSASCMACGKWVRLPAEVISREARQRWSIQLQAWAEKWL